MSKEIQKDANARMPEGRPLSMKIPPCPPLAKGGWGDLGVIFYLNFHDGSDTHACVPKRHFGVQARTMEKYRIADTDTLFSK